MTKPNSIQWLAKATSNAKPQYLYIHPDGNSGLIATDGYRIHHCTTNLPTVPPEYIVPEDIAAYSENKPLAGVFADLLRNTNFALDVTLRPADVSTWRHGKLWLYVELPGHDEDAPEYVDADYWQDALSALPQRRRTVKVAVGNHAATTVGLRICRVTIDPAHVAYIMAADVTRDDLTPVTARQMQLTRRLSWLSDQEDEAYEGYLYTQSAADSQDTYARYERIRRLMDKTRTELDNSKLKVVVKETA